MRFIRIGGYREVEVVRFFCIKFREKVCEFVFLGDFEDSRFEINRCVK